MSAILKLPQTNPESSQAIQIQSPSQAHMELQTRNRDSTSVEGLRTNVYPRPESLDVTSRRTWKLLSAAFSFFVAGVNDGSMGALLPYMLREYDIGTSFIAILYLTTFLGWLVAALTNSHAPKFFGVGALLSIGAALQLLSQVLRAWRSPFGLFAVTFFITSLGQAYQDSHANTFVSSVKGAHRWLGFIHAIYGLGCLVSPFVATPIASSNPPRWMLFYLFPLGLSVVNLVSVMIAFRESVRFIGRQPGAEEQSVGRNKNAMEEVRQVLKTRDLWIISLFFFLYLGVSVATGGWAVQYLVTVKHGNLNRMGYVSSGYYGGIFLGRLILAEPTHRFGEHRMILLYAFLCFAMQLTFWLVPNIISSAVSFSLMGFFLGPSFASGVSVASRLFPKQVQPAALGLMFVVAQAGGAIFPSLIGIIASHAGVKVLQPVIASLIVVMAVSWSFVPKPASHQE